jgi:hypothetical protein
MLLTRLDHSDGQVPPPDTRRVLRRVRLAQAEAPWLRSVTLVPGPSMAAGSEAGS